MDVMDPFTLDLLSCPAPLPSALHPTEVTELDAFLRATGDLPPFPRADTADAVHPSVEPSAPPLMHQARKRAAPISDITTAGNGKNSAIKRPRLSDYDADIDFNLRAMEEDPEEQPSPDYLETVQRGTQMTPSTRQDLVIWMDDFARYYDLAPGTLHRAVSYVDRVLSLRTLPPAPSPSCKTDAGYELQLLGATAVFTAAKYEDQSTRHKLDTAEIARYGGFAGAHEVRDMERDMCAALRYRLGGPTAYTFVDHFTRHYNSDGEEDLEVQRLAHHLASTSLADYGFLRLLPSAVAASAVSLARLTLVDPKTTTARQVQEWNTGFEELTGYRPVDLVAGMYSMCGMMSPDPRFAVLPAFLQDLWLAENRIE